MPKRRITWIVVADGGRASILTRREAERGFDVIAKFESADAHKPSRAMGSDRPGRTHESANSAHHAIEPRSDPHAASKIAFIDIVANHLNEAERQNAFDRLILVAPARSLAELRERIAAGTASKVTAMLAKDLTKMPTAELQDYLVAIS